MRIPCPQGDGDCSAHEPVAVIDQGTVSLVHEPLLGIIFPKGLEPLMQEATLLEDSSSDVRKQLIEATVNPGFQLVGSLTEGVSSGHRRVVVQCTCGHTWILDE